MAAESWNAERDSEKGLRAVVKWWPLGARYRLLKSTWHNTGNDNRDFYLAQMELMKRMADIKQTFVK